ncbi:MAG: hypothetical protein KatS3mg105_0770 [Gemmatales bacterium]|nr:MAG: hypothetical protein KatS3mg105_0770 [Gemmatales bacterium]
MDFPNCISRYDPDNCATCPVHYFCHCLKVTEARVLEALESGLTVEQIKRETGAGEGCTACHRKLVALFEQRQAVGEMVTT